MLDKRFGLTLLFLTYLTGVQLSAQSAPLLTVMSKLDSRFEIIPADAGHATALSASLVKQLDSLPTGSFVLRNRTDKAITALVVDWTFTDANGNSRQHKLTTDAYYLPIDWTVVKPLGVLLVTPSGYASEDQFQQLGASGALDPLPRMSLTMAGDKIKADIAYVSLAIDSVIFEDGAICGPDKHRYYLALLTRRSALEGLSAEFKDAKNAGEDFRAHLEKLRHEILNTKDQRSAHRRSYVDLLQRNPNPEGLLKKLELQAALPEFHHIGEESQ